MEEIIREFNFEENELESIQKIKLLEDGEVIIEYTITDEYKEKNNLFYKHRILQINNNFENENLKFQSYANSKKEV